MVMHRTRARCSALTLSCQFGVGCGHNRVSMQVDTPHRIPSNGTSKRTPDLSAPSWQWPLSILVKDCLPVVRSYVWLLGAKVPPQIHKILKTVDDGFKPPSFLMTSNAWLGLIDSGCGLPPVYRGSCPSPKGHHRLMFAARLGSPEVLIREVPFETAGIPAVPKLLAIVDTGKGHFGQFSHGAVARCCRWDANFRLVVDNYLRPPSPKRWVSGVPWPRYRFRISPGSVIVCSAWAFLGNLGLCFAPWLESVLRFMNAAVRSAQADPHSASICERPHLKWSALVQLTVLSQLMLSTASAFGC